jgi:hypothetical protein
MRCRKKTSGLRILLLSCVAQGVLITSAVMPTVPAIADDATATPIKHVPPGHHFSRSIVGVRTRRKE